MKKEAIKVLASIFGGGSSIRDVRSETRHTIRRMQPQLAKATTTSPAFNRRETEMLMRNICPMRSRG